MSLLDEIAAREKAKREAGAEIKKKPTPVKPKRGRPPMSLEDKKKKGKEDYAADRAHRAAKWALYVEKRKLELKQKESVDDTQTSSF